MGRVISTKEMHFADVCCWGICVFECGQWYNRNPENNRTCVRFVLPLSTIGVGVTSAVLWKWRGTNDFQRSKNIFWVTSEPRKRDPGPRSRAARDTARDIRSRENEINHHRVGRFGGNFNEIFPTIEIYNPICSVWLTMTKISVEEAKTAHR